MSAGTVTYVAPARYPLTELHRAGYVPPVTDDPDPADGMTVCGLPMLWDELWVPVERREGDTVCWVCEAEGGAQGAAEDAEGVLF